MSERFQPHQAPHSFAPKFLPLLGIVQTLKAIEIFIGKPYAVIFDSDAINNAAVFRFDPVDLSVLNPVNRDNNMTVTNVRKINSLNSIDNSLFNGH